MDAGKVRGTDTDTETPGADGSRGTSHGRHAGPRRHRVIAVKAPWRDMANAARIRAK